MKTDKQKLQTEKKEHTNIRIKVKDRNFLDEIKRDRVDSGLDDTISAIIKTIKKNKKFKQDIMGVRLK